jgi:hypothetical protein
MTIASNATSLIDAFLAQLPATVLIEQQEGVCAVQPQTIDDLQMVLTLLSQPEWASIQIVQTAHHAETLETVNKLWLDTTVATATIYNHKPADFVITVGTGKTLEAVEKLLQSTNQTLAFTPANTNSCVTIGELLANNTLPLEANIRRSTFNELVLGCSAFSPITGELVSFGGEVVKNVTGYDVQKFLVGHQHALGVVSSVTLRTTPLLPVKGRFERIFQTEVNLFTCLQACLTKPSLWMTHLLVKPHPEGFCLSVGVEAPSVALLEAWQSTNFPNSDFQTKNPLDSTPLLAIEIALPLGESGWQKVVNHLIPTLNADNWQWLPACGVLQVFYQQTPPTINQLESLYKQVAIIGGSVRLIQVDASLKPLSAEIYRLQWAMMPTALQRQHHQLKQLIDPNNQFYSPFYPRKL